MLLGSLFWEASVCKPPSSHDLGPGDRKQNLPCLGAEMRAAPLSDVKKTNVFLLMPKFCRRLRIFPTLSSISRTASPYLQGKMTFYQAAKGISVTQILILSLQR